MRGKIFICIGIIILFVIYISIDYIRLKKSDEKLKPVVTLYEKTPSYKGGKFCSKYYGLGYTIQYFWDYEKPDKNGIIKVELKQKEFKVLDIFSISM